MKAESSLVTFVEIPDEINLCLNITGCPFNCPECFEPWLKKYHGEDVTIDYIKGLIAKNRGVSCVVFLGGDAYIEQICNLSALIRECGLKVAMYSGRPVIVPELVEALDYYKVGPYDPVCGPLNLKTTNQRLYNVQNNELEDITYKFWKD